MTDKWIIYKQTASDFVTYQSVEVKVKGEDSIANIFFA